MFGGDRTLTREETVTFLFRASGSPGGGVWGSDVYDDVPAGRSHWADRPIGWAYDQGITGGSSPRVFGFGTATVREDMVLFLCRTVAPEVCAPLTTSGNNTGGTVPTTTTTVPPTTTTGPPGGSPGSDSGDISGVQLVVASEKNGGYNRDDWGPHGSGLCRGAVGASDPYTGTTIDRCNVDHVVALHEAHQSGGWAWSSAKKQQFSSDASNHVASRACVNQSKSSHDIAEWSDARIASSSACGGGYSVTPAGRCFYARTTVEVKSAWGLSVDQTEQTVLAATLADCGDPSVGLDTTAPTTPPANNTGGVCVISGRTAAEYDAVSGIGATLAARLRAAQPFTSVADLDAVSGIGPVKANAVWNHFCR